MSRKTGAIIPDPVSPSGSYRRVLCIPASPEWIGLVNGALWVMTQAWYWDGATGDIDAVLDRAKQMYFEFQDESGECDPVTLWVGKVEMSASQDNPPDGWLECNGDSLLRTDYPDLFTALGTQWGAVDSTHFTIPDYRGRAPMGVGRVDGNMANPLWQMGNKVGAETVTLTTSEIPSHQHASYDAGLWIVGTTGAPAGVMPSGAGAPASVNTGLTGGGGAHENHQPTQTIRFFIYAGA